MQMIEKHEKNISKGGIMYDRLNGNGGGGSFITPWEIKFNKHPIGSEVTAHKVGVRGGYA